MKKMIALLLTFAPLLMFPQLRTETISVPGGVKKKCDEVLLKDLGKTMFKTCITFQSASGLKKTFNDGIREEYKVKYLFSFPSVKSASLVLGFEYVDVLGSTRLQSSAFLRSNQSDLPPDIQSKGMDIITYEKAREVALNSDTGMTKHADRVKGEFHLNGEGLFWHFSYSYLDPEYKGNKERQIVLNVFVDPYSGKIKRKFTNYW